MQGGTLRLLELAVPVEDRVIRSDTGFPIVAVPSRYFWLCPECARSFEMRRWTADGLILEPRLPENHQKALLVKVAPIKSVARSRLQALSARVA